MTDEKTKLIEAGFEPRWILDLKNATAKSLAALIEQIHSASEKEPPNGPVSWQNGWYLFTPQMGEAALLRNPLGANRKMSLTSVTYYAEQMARDEWPKTGQPLIFSDTGTLLDGQHRIAAGYLSNTPFWTYIVSDVPESPHLFAFIDNVKARTPANALQTAGLNGASAVISQVLKMAVEYEAGVYTGSQVLRHPRMAPVQYLQAIDRHPNARRAVHLTNSDYEQAVTVLGGHKDVVGFVTMKIIDLFGQPTADLFFDELMADDNDDAKGNPVAALRKLMADDAKKQKQMKRHIALGNVILAFNAWKQDEPVKKRWFMASHEEFPRFIEPAPEEDSSDEEGRHEPEHGIEGFRSTGPAGDELEYAARLRETEAEIEARP